MKAPDYVERKGLLEPAQVESDETLVWRFPKSALTHLPKAGIPLRPESGRTSFMLSPG